VSITVTSVESQRRQTSDGGVSQGYRLSDAGLIPDDWDVDTLASTTPPGERNGIVDGPFGSNLKTIHYRHSGIPIITSGYVTDGVFRAEEYLYVDQAKFKAEKRSAVRPGDIVMAKIGARCGASAILPSWHQTGILSGNALKITVDNTRHDTYYVWQVLWNLYSNGNIEPLKTVGAQPAISMANLKKYKLPLPGQTEQRAIAAALSDVDALIGTLDKLITKKRGMKLGAMQQLLTGRTRLPGFSDPWDTKRIGEFADCTAGGTPSTLVSSYWGGSNRWMSSGELSLKVVTDVEGRITDLGLRHSSAKMLPPECVLIGLAGQGKTRGTVAINKVPLATNQSIAAVYPNDSFWPDYLYYNLDSRYGELRSLSSGGSGRGGLNLRIIRSVHLPFPHPDEQRAIATVLSDMDAEITALERRRDKTKATKQGMMQALLTGRTRLV
jgi:type I restriction enzyme S subunit